MTELDVRILQVKNGFTVDVSYTLNGDYENYVLIAATYEQVVEMVTSLKD